MASPGRNMRPKLSLAIDTTAQRSSRVTSRRVAMIDPKSPTAFNTLSNVYATAIDRSTPIQQEPLTAINTQSSLRIQTNMGAKAMQHRTQTPYTATYPDTPLTAHPISPAVEMSFPSTMTATPPLSAGPADPNVPTFTFTAPDVSSRLTIDTGVVSAVSDLRTPRRRTTFPTTPVSKPPYTHPRTLHSILRNSPLPPPSARLPISPRRQSLRLQEKAAKRVEYHNPLTQTIVNNKYTRSHIDLLVEEASPLSPFVAQEQQQTVLDLALAFTGNETRDGGQTPGPFEEMRRRMAGLGTSSPLTAGSAIRKRKRKDKKRQWRWTINQEEELGEDASGAMAAIRAAEMAMTHAADDRTPIVRAPGTHPFLPPTPSCESQDSGMESLDVEMSDSSSLVSDDRAMTPAEMDLDDLGRFGDIKSMGMVETPVVMRRDRLGSVDLVQSEQGSRGDTPVPPDLLMV